MKGKPQTIEMSGVCRLRVQRGGIPSAFSGDDSLALPHGLLDLFLKLLTFKRRTRAAGQRERAKS